MHVHASDRQLSEAGSAKLFVYKSGDTKIMARGTVNEKDMRKIQAYIKANHMLMYEKWVRYSDNGYYGE